MMEDMSHTPQLVLKEKLLAAEALVPTGAHFVHFKTNEHTYIIRSLAILEETMEVAVIYEGQYEERLSFIRPLANFLEEVEFNGATVRRFQRVD